MTVQSRILTMFFMVLCLQEPVLAQVPVSRPEFKSGVFRDTDHGLMFRLNWPQETFRTGRQVARELEKRGENPVPPNVDMVAGLFHSDGDRYVLIWKWPIQTEKIQAAWTSWQKEHEDDLTGARIDTRRKQATALLRNDSRTIGRLITQWSADALYFVAFYGPLEKSSSEYSSILESVRVKKSFTPPQYPLWGIVAIAAIIGPLVIFGVVFLANRRN